MTIQTATLQWKEDDNGVIVPVSDTFGDIYYSLADGLEESRYVFLQGNNLSQRLSISSDNTHERKKEVFTIAELGFGTGLNFFATWQLWNEITQSEEYSQNQDKRHYKQLHFISFEKYPLTKADFIQSLLPWKHKDPKIAQLITKFESIYPTLVAGCHRFNFYEDNIILDLWLGEATESLEQLAQSKEHIYASGYDASGYVDAWFLDGFHPACNIDLWAEEIFLQIRRLSQITTTVATYSCAGIVKRGLKNIGFDIKKIKGFARKREMLIAELTNQTISSHQKTEHTETLDIPEQQNVKNCDSDSKNRYSTGTSIAIDTVSDLPIVIIGAGISGLMTAWSLAHRNQKIVIVDKNLPMSGASGNPKAVLAPKMTPIHHVADHLHSIGYLFSSRVYQQMNEIAKLMAKEEQSEKTEHLEEFEYNQVIEMTTAIDFMTKANISTEQVSAYPSDFAQVLTNEQAQRLAGLKKQNLSVNQHLVQAGLVDPQILAKVVLAHENISFQSFDVESITQDNADKGNPLTLISKPVIERSAKKSIIPNELHAQKVVICSAYHSHDIDNRIFDFRKIRGQLSWFTPSVEQLKHLPKIPLKFGGYCTPFTVNQNDDMLNNVKSRTTHFLIGASFIRNTTDTNIVDAEHKQNYQKLITAIPELSSVMGNFDVCQWHGRAGIRSQTPDYHPLVGRLMTSTHQHSHASSKDTVPSNVWTLSGMGAKGYAYAPICAEVLADLMTGSIPPLSQELLKKLNPNRNRLQTSLT